MLIVCPQILILAVTAWQIAVRGIVFVRSVGVFGSFGVTIHVSLPVCSLSPDGVLSNNSTSETQLGRVMLEQAKKSVLLLNSQKTEESKKLNTLCTLNDIDFIVSEKDISNKFPEYKEKFIY